MKILLALALTIGLAGCAVIVTSVDVVEIEAKDVDVDATVRTD